MLCGKAELCPAALGVVLRFAAVLLIRRLESAQTAHFLENALGIKLVLQPIECAIYLLTFANEYFWHRYSTPIPCIFFTQMVRSSLIVLCYSVESATMTG